MGKENVALDTSKVPITSLTGEASRQFKCRWVTLSTLPGLCTFTLGIDQSIALPNAYGEGHFVLANPDLLSVLQDNGRHRL